MRNANNFIRRNETLTTCVLITLGLVTAFFTANGVLVSVYSGDHWFDRAPAVVLGIGVFSMVMLFLEGSYVKVYNQLPSFASAAVHAAV